MVTYRYHYHSTTSASSMLAKGMMTSEGLEPPASGFGILRASSCANRPDLYNMVMVS
jgi:hypothetical protein